MILDSFPHYLQLDALDCGPSCLRMVAKYYGKTYSLQTLRERCFITREGVSLLGVSDAAAIQGKHLLMVDDVVTTGATVIACVQELCKAGNVKVSVIALGFSKS